MKIRQLREKKETVDRRKEGCENEETETKRMNGKGQR